MYQLIIAIVSIALFAAVTVAGVSYLPISTLIDHRVTERAYQDFLSTSKAVKKYLLSNTDENGVPKSGELLANLTPITDGTYGYGLSSTHGFEWEISSPLNSNTVQICFYKPNIDSNHRVLTSLQKRLGPAAVLTTCGSSNDRGVAYRVHLDHIAPPIMPSIVYEKPEETP